MTKKICMAQSTEELKFILNGKIPLFILFLILFPFELFFSIPKTVIFLLFIFCEIEDKTTDIGKPTKPWPITDILKSDLFIKGNK